MQKFTQKYTIVHLVHELADGTEFSMEAWPLHFTLVDVFGIEGKPRDVLTDLRLKFNSNIPVQTIVNGDEWFGEDKSIHVKLLENTDRLQQLHEDIIEVLGLHKVTFNNPEYTGKGFLPHSTVQKNTHLSSGDKVTFNSLTLIDMFPHENPYQRRVLGTIYFKKV